MTSLILAAIAFVGSHFLLSHPLRAGLVGRLGEKGFMGLYSLVALASFVWLVLAFRAAPPQAPLWPAGDILWGLSTLLMLLASILFAGSLFHNPALPQVAGAALAERRPGGVFAITRHPMMWSFALWALSHVLVSPRPAVLLLGAAIAILALGGAAAQDAKKARLIGEPWRAWQARTSFIPFGRGGRLPSAGVLIGGVLLWLAATYGHIGAIGIPAGIWRWV